MRHDSMSTWCQSFARGMLGRKRPRNTVAGRMVGGMAAVCTPAVILSSWRAQRS